MDVLTGPPVCLADLLPRRFRGESVIRLRLGELLVNLLHIINRTNTPLNEEISRSGGGLKVKCPRPPLEIRLRYVVFPEETHWRCERASTKRLVRLRTKSCGAPGEEEV